ncbi:BatA domain-containing protein [Tautonia marina]|uniref:BatA domain-containing protein n=1 Tax=Tautonia marina TaxID=2653855 RepID=UPI001260F979|nr:BatA domain-containing protein [Tautonia marina]
MMTFLTPLLLWGTLLGAVPLIIHLLNRRRFRRVDWAPMRLLKLTVRRNRRRLQIEQWLLLLLRIALPILLFLMLARPILDPTGLEGWAGPGSRTSRIVLVDDSLSMGYVGEGPPAFQQAREVAAALLSQARPQDRCSLVTTSMPGVPVLLEVEGSRQDELANAALGLSPTETHTAWPAVFEGLNGVLESCTFPTQQLTIITDLRRSGWDEGVGPIARAWQERGLVVRIVDVGDDGDRAGNLAVEALEPMDRTILADAESRWEATIRNDSPRTIAGVSAILRVDDAPTEFPLPEIAPNSVARVPITVRFPGPGPHDLAIELPEDSMPGDNRRWAAVEVKEALRIRLVDGEPSSEPFGGEVDYLAAPLSIGVGDADAWRVEVVQEDDFLSNRLELPDVLILANVAAPTPEQADRLIRLVRDGMGLMIFAGARMDVGSYHDLLDRDEARLLPARMRAMVDQEIRGVIIEPVRPSPLEALLELRPSALERVAARQIMTVEESAEDSEGDVRVLARWNDPERSPAVIERIVGEGRVLLWTTTADRDGNDWPVEPSFVLAIREAVRGTARATPLAKIVTAGEPIRNVVESSQSLSDIRLFPPNDAEPRVLNAVPINASADESPSTSLAIDVLDTRRAGLYRITWSEGPLGAQSDLSAANPDPIESELDRIGRDELTQLLSPLEVELASARSGTDALLAPTGRELWRALAWGLLALMIAEPMLTAWIGRSR